MSGKGVSKAQADVLAKFRQSQAKNTAVVADIKRAQEERSAKAKADPSKAAAARRAPPKARAKPTASATTSDGGRVSMHEALATAKAKSPLPLGLRHKKVLDFLQRCEAAGASAAEVRAATGHDLAADSQLAAALAGNPKVRHEPADEGEDGEARWAYVPDAGGVRDRGSLLEYVWRRGAPVAVSEVADAYRAVMADIEALKAEGAILALFSQDPDLLCEVLYAKDQALAGLRVDDDVLALWRGTAVPEEEEELAAELAKAGLKPTPRKAPRKREAAKRKKARKQARLRAVTNVHLMHLLEGDAPAQIE